MQGCLHASLRTETTIISATEKKIKQLNVILHYLKLQDDPVLKSFNPIPYAISTSVPQPGDVSCFSQKADQSTTGVPDTKPHCRISRHPLHHCRSKHWKSWLSLLIHVWDRQDSTQDRSIFQSTWKRKADHEKVDLKLLTHPSFPFVFFRLDNCLIIWKQHVQRSCVLFFGLRFCQT